MGLSSIAANASTANLSWKGESNLGYSHIEIGSNLTSTLGTVSVQILDVNTVDCTYNVYKNGIWQASFTRSTCDGAMHAACLFIMSQGGTCPIGY